MFLCSVFGVISVGPSSCCIFSTFLFLLRAGADGTANTGSDLTCALGLFLQLAMGFDLKRNGTYMSALSEGSSLIMYDEI